MINKEDKQMIDNMIGIIKERRTPILLAYADDSGVLHVNTNMEGDDACFVIQSILTVAIEESKKAKIKIERN